MNGSQIVVNDRVLYRFFLTIDPVSMTTWSLESFQKSFYHGFFKVMLATTKHGRLNTPNQTFRFTKKKVASTNH